VKDYLFWFDMPGEHIGGIMVAAGASAIRADFAAADHRYARRVRPCRCTTASASAAASPGLSHHARHVENTSKEGRANVSEDEFGDHETKENCNDFEFFCALSF
jgi:hypothetical protein